MMSAEPAAFIIDQSYKLEALASEYETRAKSIRWRFLMLRISTLSRKDCSYYPVLFAALDHQLLAEMPPV